MDRRHQHEVMDDENRSFVRSLTRPVRRWLAETLGRRCVLCLEPSQERNLCGCCHDALPSLGISCRTCALPLPIDEPQPACGACLRRSPPWRRAIAATCYASPVSELVSAFKFGRDLAAGQALAELLLACVEARSYAPNAVLMPVPLHRSRLRERGFNQALELARPIGRKLNLPVSVRTLRRTRATAPQSGTATTSQRSSNIRGAFELAGPAPETVILLDDVYTTGATLRECAQLLARGGTQTIEVWVVARTLQPAALRSQ